MVFTIQFNHVSSDLYLHRARQRGAYIALDLHAMTNLEDPTEHARKLLREHQSCDRVEIWQDETFIVAVSRVTSRDHHG
jgi:hypothetical protein